MDASTEHRRAVLEGNLARVRARIADAATAAHRDPAEITVIAVTKFFPAADVRHLADIGITDVGENRHQEAAEKAAACADLTSLRWHYIGGLQSNKAASVARYADVVQSVDRVKLLPGLARGAAERGRILGVMVQVSLDLADAGGSSARAGVLPSETLRLADAIAAESQLGLLGVMAVAPLGEDPAPAFERLARIAEEVRRNHPGATAISAGMSGDLEAAIRFGATHVRVGSAILGNRPLSK
ncbi:MAG: YggS family pyridoxal phosphate-dependent enzyme [Marmoricola sp.]